MDSNKKNQLFNQILAIVNELLNEEPQHKGLLQMRGEIYTWLKDPNLLLSSADDFIKHFPQEAQAWDQKATALHVLGDLENALTAYEKVYGLNEHFFDSFVEKGAVLNQLGRYQEALDWLDFCLKKDSKNSRAWAIKAASHSAMGELQKSSECLAKSLKLNPPK